MKLCFDANAVIDVFLISDDFFHSYVSYDVALLNKHEVYVCASSMPTIAYVLHRRGLPVDKVSRALPSIFELFNILDVTESDCKLAATSDMRDYEDAVIAESCKRNGVDLIITRNIRDFANSPVPAATPEDFVKVYKPSNYEYDIVDL